MGAILKCFVSNLKEEMLLLDRKENSIPLLIIKVIPCPTGSTLQIRQHENQMVAKKMNYILLGIRIPQFNLSNKLIKEK